MSDKNTPSYGEYVVKRLKQAAEEAAQTAPREVEKYVRQLLKSPDRRGQ